jgi:hypothetical protein
MNTSASEPVVRCQGRPAAARRWGRDDALCASVANTAVPFLGVEVPVCRMHEATYARWGADAEVRALERWGWQEHAPAVSESASARWWIPARRLAHIVSLSRSCRPGAGAAWRPSPGEIPR